MEKLSKYLSSLTKPELEGLMELLNLTEDEEKVFIGLSKGRSITRISQENFVSAGTISNRISAIRKKMMRVL